MKKTLAILILFSPLIANADDPYYDIQVTGVGCGVAQDSNACWANVNLTITTPCASPNGTTQNSVRWYVRDPMTNEQNGGEEVLAIAMSAFTSGSNVNFAIDRPASGTTDPEPCIGKHPVVTWMTIRN